MYSLTSRAFVLALAVLEAGSPAAVAGASATIPRPVIDTADVGRFYRLYDAADGHPSAATLQRDYIDVGSDGLKQLARLRKVTGASIADAIARQPQTYIRARDCEAVLPRVRARLSIAMGKLATLYPDARFPPLTITIGHGKPVGVGTRETGVQIGLEALCLHDWINPDIEDRFVRIAMHEFAHVQQAVAFSELPGATVLSASLEEGTAEFVTELTTGGVAYRYMDRLVAGREVEIETAFQAEMDQTDLSAWLYNSKPEAPADLGYWVGYRIVKSYYERAHDRHQALAAIFGMTDPRAFLAASGWQPETPDKVEGSPPQ